MKESRCPPLYRFARLLALFSAIVGLCYAFPELSIPNAMSQGIEPDRISHYDAESIPAWVRKDLPPITDPDGKRDTFFYPDGIGKGRVVHMRFPANYVSSILGQTPPRHSESLVFYVVYPDLVSISTPSIWNEMYRYGGRVPDDEMDIGIVRSSPKYLTEQAERYARRVEEMKAKNPDIKFISIPVPLGFSSPHCKRCRAQGQREIIEYNDATLNFKNNREVTDVFIEWNEGRDVTRMMTCANTDRPMCEIEISANAEHPLYRLDVGFHVKNLGRLREVIDRITKSINSSVIEIIQ